MRFRTISAIAALAFASSASSHHSDAALDMTTRVAIEGTVTEYSLRNPHSYLTVETLDDSGKTVEWEVQMGSAISMASRGWTRDTLTVGDSVSVGLRPSRDGRPYGLIVSIEREGVPISYERLPRPNEVASTDSLEGIWIVDRASLGPNYPGGLDQLTIRDLELTEKGRIAEAAYSQNDADNPELTCMTKPTPGGLVYTDVYPMQIEFNEDEETVTIRVQFFDQVRTVYMDGRGHPPSDQRTHEGHSIGWWEGDMLVIDTTNFADNRSPYQNGIPSGAQKHVVERYRLGDDGTRMTLTFTLEDPEYVVGSMTHTRDLLYSPHLRMTPFNCDPEATRRFVPR